MLEGFQAVEQAAVRFGIGLSVKEAEATEGLFGIEDIAAPSGPKAVRRRRNGADR